MSKPLTLEDIQKAAEIAKNKGLQDNTPLVIPESMLRDMERMFKEEIRREKQEQKNNQFNTEIEEIING